MKYRLKWAGKLGFTWKFTLIKHSKSVGTFKYASGRDYLVDFSMIVRMFVIHWLFWKLVVDLETKEGYSKGNMYRELKSA